MWITPHHHGAQENKNTTTLQTITRIFTRLWNKEQSYLQQWFNYDGSRVGNCWFMELCPVWPQSCAYHSATIWNAKCLARRILIGLEERTSCQVFHPDVLRGKRWLEEDSFPRKHKEAYGLRVLGLGPLPYRDKLVSSLCLQEDEECVCIAFTSGAESKTASMQPRKDTDV